MKGILQGTLSKRWGFDGWALMHEGAARPMHWTACTTREECREVQKARPDLFDKTKVVKVNIEVIEVQP